MTRRKWHQWKARKKSSAGYEKRHSSSADYIFLEWHLWSERARCHTFRRLPGEGFRSCPCTKNSVLVAIVRKDYSTWEHHEWFNIYILFISFVIIKIPFTMKILRLSISEHLFCFILHLLNYLLSVQLLYFISDFIVSKCY